MQGATKQVSERKRRELTGKTNDLRLDKNTVVLYAAQNVKRKY